MQQREPPADMEKSPQALAQLYREHRDQLHDFVLGLLRNRAEADDVLQQVFLKLVENWESIEVQSVKGWLFTVAYHESLALRRRRKLQDSALAELWSRPVWHSRSPGSSDEPALRSEAVDAVRRALQGLPDSQREVVERRVYRNQTFAAIAAELHCPLGTVLTRMRLALKSLAPLLEE